MLDPITILSSLGWLYAKRGGDDPAAQLLAQLFGGVAGSALHGDVRKLRDAFLSFTEPDSNQDLERAAAKAALHADLFCLMEALGEPLEKPDGKIEEWQRIVERRMPAVLKEYLRQKGGALSEAGHERLIRAKADCERRLGEIEKRFTPSEISPHEMLAPVEADYAKRRGLEALKAIEGEGESYDPLPERARRAFEERWFQYLCGSFHFEIKRDQGLANIQIAISLEGLHDKVDEVRSDVKTLLGQKSKKRPGPYASVPKLPPTFIERPVVSEPLKRLLLSGSETVGITAVAGMGGVGKTVVALELCHDEEVRKAFPDGIVWVPVGRESGVTVKDRLRRVVDAIDPNVEGDPQDAYRSVIDGKAVLVVLDDVWALEDVEPFLPGEGICRLLYTSRDQGLAGRLGAESRLVGELAEGEDREFLAEWAGLDAEKLPEPHATGILRECKRLALGLAMVGAALKGAEEQEWADALADLEEADLKRIERTAGYGHETLHAAIAVGVNALRDEDKERYLALAVLLEDMAAPGPVLQALWGGKPRDVRRTARLLVERSLASRDPEGGIRLHDFQLDYVRGEFGDWETLGLLHSAFRLSAHVVRERPEEFVSQMTGRLVGYKERPGVAGWLAALEVRARRPWLRATRPALIPAGGPARRVIEGHTAPIRAVALTADGKVAVTGSNDATVRVWDPERDGVPRVLKGHTGRVLAVALSANGNRVVTGSDDAMVLVWDLRRGGEPQVIEGHTGVVLAVALTADGKRAVTGSHDGTVRVWDLEGDGEPRVLEGHTDGVVAVAVTADGKRAVTGSNDQTVRVWDLGRGESRVLERHTGGVNAVALSADGKRMVTGSDDRRVRVWDLGGGEPRALEGHTGRVLAVALSADGKRVVTGSDDKTVRVWDPESGEPRALEGHTGRVLAVAVTADGKRVVTGSDDETVRVWDLEEDKASSVLDGHTIGGAAVALSADGKRAVTGAWDSTVRVWDLGAGGEPRVLKGHRESVIAVVLTADGKRAVTGSWDRTARVWDLEEGGEPQVLEGHSDGVIAVAISADGKRAVTGSHDRTVRVWDLKGNGAPRVLKGHTSSVMAVALSADGNRGATGSDDGTVRVWDLKGDGEPRVLKGHTGPVTAVALTADGKRAVTGSHDGTVRVWDLKGNGAPQVLKGHTGPVTAVALTADGKQAVMGSRNGTVRVWDLASGKCLAVFSCDGWVEGVAWGGGRMVAAAAFGRLHVLELVE